MTICKTLCDIWFRTYLIVINSYLTYNSISNYINFKSNSLDLSNGQDWDQNLVYLILQCIIIPLALLPVILYTNIVPQGNLANDGHILGKDEETFHFINENGKASIVLNKKEKYCGCKNQLLKLIHMEIPPTSYVLHFIASYIYLIPKPFMDAEQILHRVLKQNQIWHSDLDILFDPDSQHEDFTNFQQWNNIQPMSIAYFNLGFSLFLLSIKYSRVFWNVSRTFTMVLSFMLIVFSVHILLEYCSLSVMIKICENPLVVASKMRLNINAFTILFLSIVANVILLFSFATIFHYGILQYGDIMIHKNRRICRQMMTSSPQIIGSNQLDLAGPFSPCVSENNYSESSIEPIFSKSHLSHIFAITFLLITLCLKAPIVYLSFKHLYNTTSDLLTLVNIIIGCLFASSWLILWFAFALRRTWNFKIKSSMKCATDQMLLNGNTLLNNTGHMQLHQMQNAFLLNPKTSDLNLSKQEMIVNRNVALDGCSDETDMSSKLSSNNYVFLQSMRNGGTMGFDMNGQASLLRNPLYLSYSMNNPNAPNPNLIYANEDSLNIRSTNIDDQLGSEHSYNSNRSRNLGFEILPPILPNFDENRYKHFNQNSAAIEKLIPRYLRNQSLDMNGTLQMSMGNHDLVNSPTTTTMSYTFDSNLQSYNNRFKQTNIPSGQMRSPEKFSNLHGMVKGGVDQLDFLSSSNDEDGQRRAFLNGDSTGRSSMDSTKRLVKSPLIFQTVEEAAGDIHPSELDSVLPPFGNNNDMIPTSSNNPPNDLQTHMINNNNNNQTNDRMCSQV